MKKKVRQEWEADERFLTFLLSEYQKNGYDPQAILLEEGDAQFTVNEFIDLMRNGQDWGRRLYNQFYDKHKEEFKLSLHKP